jgi:AcrR family transcriptional regulator
MARPVAADAERTRRRIVSAAIAAIGRRGMDGSTLREIADQVGVTFATIHHHFGSKQRLYEACLDRAFDELAEIGASAIGAMSRAPRRERIATAVRAAFRAARKNPDRSRFLLRAFVFEESEATKRRLAEAQRRLLEHGVELLGGDARFGRRIPLLALGILITRFAVSQPAERVLLAEEVGDPDVAIEEYLVQVAEQSLRSKGLAA